MLKPTRLTFDNSTRSNLSTSLDKTTRRGAAFCALAFLLNGVAFAGDGAFNASRSLGVQDASSTQPLPNKRLTIPAQTSQDLTSELAQLEFRFQEAQKVGSEQLDRLTPQIAELLEAARRLEANTESDADAQLNERAQALVLQLVEFQRFLSATSDFFQRLAQLDVASLNEKATRDFFASFVAPDATELAATPYYAEVSNSASAPNAAIATYRAELNRVAASFNALQTVEHWNVFVETHGSAL
jgi:hypothetical protein